MKNNQKFDDTISDISIQDILNEMKSDAYDNTDEISLDEILAEFSEVPAKVTSQDCEISAEKSDATQPKAATPKKDISPAIKSSPIPKEIIKTSWQKEKIEKTETLKIQKDAYPIVENPIKTKNDAAAESQKEEVQEKSKEPRIVNTIVRPWENGVYGDMNLNADDKSKKKRKVSKFAETFDTFTRSELFEDKKGATIVETRSADEILSENLKLSKSLGLRVVCLLVLSILSCYIAFAEPLGLYLPRAITYVSHPFRYLFITAFFQISAMLLAVDIISRGLGKLIKLRPDVESAIAFSSFATLAHVISVMVAPHWRGWLPYSCISVTTLFFSICSKYLYSRALCRVCKTVKAAQEPNLVYLSDVYGQNHIVKQSCKDTTSFVAHINDKDASRTFWTFLSPVLIVSSIVFAAISSFGTDTPEHFFWALAGISVVTTPFFAMLSFSFPFAITAKNLASVGAAISGWYSATNLAKKANFVVCDRDVFPKGTVILHGLKILGNFSLEKTVCYAASIIGETQSGLCDVFVDLLKSRYGELTNVKNLRYHETGGLEAEIGNDSVLIGSAGFMLRSGVRLAAGTSTKNAVLIAINRHPAGVFNINYKSNMDVERALHMLVKRKIPVVLAVRDFNLLPMMVEQAFDLKDGALEYPEIEQRIDLSSEEQLISSDAAAVVTRNGLYPFAASALFAKKLRNVTIRNICLNAAAALIGMILMFYLTFIQRPILVTPHTVFVYMMLWCIPTYLLSLKVKK